MGDSELKAYYITNYHKRFLGTLDENNFNIVGTQNQDIPQVLQEENNLLMTSLSGCYQKEYNKSPSPNGFPIEFYI